MDRANYRRSNASKASAIAVMMVKSSVVPLSVFMSCPPCPWFVRIVTPFETRSPLHLNPLQRWDRGFRVGSPPRFFSECTKEPISYTSGGFVPDATVDKKIRTKA